jgi:hypothetical protein
MAKFIGNDLIANGPDPLTGRTPTETERLREVIENAVLYEQLGFDGFSVGERHHPFLSSAPPVGAEPTRISLRAAAAVRCPRGRRFGVGLSRQSLTRRRAFGRLWPPRPG